MDYPRPQSRRQAVAWWLEDNAIAILLTVLATPIAIPVLLYLGATMMERVTAPEQYPYSGFCPDCPAHYDTPACPF